MTVQNGPELTTSWIEEPPMELNIPEVVAEVRAAFLRYQHAVDTNDVETMNELFWTSPFTVRFGPNGTLIGHDAIANYRQTRTATAEPRTLRNTVITTFGRDFATASTLFHRATSPGKVGRQQQSWARFDDGWHIVAAHVSVIDGT